MLVLSELKDVEHAKSYELNFSIISRSVFYDAEIVSVKGISKM